MNPTLSRSAALVVLPLGLAVGLFAQDTDKKKTAHERLQPYWSQLDLNERQRAEYDRVARQYGPQIDELETKLEALKEKRHKAWMAVLTSEQKLKLEHLRANRGRKKDADEKREDIDPSRPRKETKQPPERSTEDPNPPKRKATKKDD